jgi:hypothetical protein
MDNKIKKICVTFIFSFKKNAAKRAVKAGEKAKIIPPSADDV